MIRYLELLFFVYIFFQLLEGKYNLFYTCNTWANNVLKSANLKACLFTLTPKTISPSMLRIC